MKTEQQTMVPHLDALLRELEELKGERDKMQQKSEQVTCAC